MNAITTPVSSTFAIQNFFMEETAAKTDIEFWQTIGRRMIQERFKEVKRSNTDTSLKTHAWFEMSKVDSTSLLQTPTEAISKKIELLFRSYAYEDFEDGIENNFINELRAYILKFGVIAVDTIANVIDREGIKAQVTFEALRWLGSIPHLESHRSRLFLLERCLRNPSRWVRDGAALGLASLKDVHAVPYLRDAIEREQIQDLRKDLKVVLNRIEQSPHAPLSSKNK